MRRVMVLLGLLTACGQATAQPAPISAPKIAVDDTWTYRETNERATGFQESRVEMTVLRVGPSTITLSVRPAGSTVQPTEMLLGRDWSRHRSLGGKDTIVNQPVNFPLSPGKHWEINYAEDHPNPQLASEAIHSPYVVTEWEDVTVAAGTFHAIKVECEGEWKTVVAPGVSSASGVHVDARGTTMATQSTRNETTVRGGRTYKVVWYAPEVKRWVKSQEDYFDPNGKRYIRNTSELLSYKVAG